VDKTVVGLAFAAICFVLKQSCVFIIGKIEGVNIPIASLFNTWSLVVVLVAAFLTYFITFVTFKAKHPVIVGLVASLVGSLVFLPGLLPDVSTPEWISFLIVALEWLVIGTLTAYLCFGMRNKLEKLGANAKSKKGTRPNSSFHWAEP